MSAYGTLDTGVPNYTSPANLAKLGTDVTFAVIDGGNHEQMGWYTGQPNDPPATISRADQQAQVVGATVPTARPDRRILIRTGQSVVGAGRVRVAGHRATARPGSSPRRSRR